MHDPSSADAAAPRDDRAAPALHFERRGHGPPLVLLHGLGSELCVWEPVLEPLAERHDVIAVDLPGFGRSPALTAGVTPTPAALAAAVGRLMDALGVAEAQLAGNSLGAWVALELAVRGRARAVAGVCPAGLWPTPRRAAGGGGPAAGRAHRLAHRGRLLLPLLLLAPPVRRAVLSPFVARPERVPYRAAERMIGSYARATAYEATSAAMRADRFRAADELRVPVTLAFGERDRLIRPDPSAIPGARLVALPGCGHIPMWDDPPLVARTILDAIRLAPATGG